MTIFKAIARIALSMCISCGVSAAPELSASTQTIQPDDWIDSVVILHFAPQPRGEPDKIAADLLRSDYTFFSQRTERQSTIGRPSVFVERVNMKAVGIEPPSARTLQYFGRGVSAAQVEMLQKSTDAVVLVFSYGKDDVLEGVAQAARFSNELAKRIDALIWDDETRELFTVDAWKQSRIDFWLGGDPLVSKQTTVHAYKDGDDVRAISLGMRKFGLPDIVVNNFSWSDSHQMDDLIIALMQILVEGATAPAQGPFDVDIRKIKYETLRKSLVESLFKNAKGVGLLTLTRAQREDGDPDNRLLEITFERYSGKSVHERQNRLLSAMFGLSDAGLARAKATKPTP